MNLTEFYKLPVVYIFFFILVQWKICLVAYMCIDAAERQHGPVSNK